MEVMAWTMEPTTDDRRPATDDSSMHLRTYALRTDPPLRRAPSTGVHRDERGLKLGRVEVRARGHRDEARAAVVGEVHEPVMENGKIGNARE